MLLNFRSPNVCIFFSFFLAGPFLQAQSQTSTIEICVNTILIEGNRLIADVFLTSEEPLLGMQFGLEWSEEDLEFLEIVSFNEVDLPSTTGPERWFGRPPTSNIPENQIWFSWLSFGGTLSADLSEGVSIFRLAFDLKPGGSPNIEMIGIDNPSEAGILPEFTGESGIIDAFEFGTCAPKTYITGQVNLFGDTDCSNPFPTVNYIGWKVAAVSEERTIYRSVSPNGSYYIPVPLGIYDLTLIPPTDLWTPCVPSVSIEVPTLESDYTLDLGAYANRVCPLLSVDLSTPFLRRCFDNFYVCQYDNTGTERIENAYVQIIFDPWMRIDSASIPWDTREGQLFTFPVGDLEPGAGGRFKVYFNLSCEAELGITHCSEAQILPRTACKEPSSLWSGAEVEVSGSCEDEDVQFVIRNTGTSDMLQPVKYIVTEDIVMMQEEVIQLNQGATQVVSFPASGKTFRIEVQQVAYYPGESMPSATVEGCTTGESISLGIINQFPLDDADLFLDLDCKQNIGSFDPNDKQAFPQGYGINNNLLANTEIEYLIRFQNTGTDTAFTVEILDTLSPLLDPTSIRPGVSSHDYQFDLLEGGVLRFHFANILLPDSTTNEPASNGFVKFKVDQQANLSIGSVIENRAGIYFDFNEPIITNTTFHTIAEPLFSQETIVQTQELFQQSNVTVSPNPFRGITELIIKDGPNGVYQFELYDGQGRLIQHQWVEGERFQIECSGCQSGVYYYQLYTDQQRIASGKLIIE